jgi:dihydroorotate dehydrogenase
MNAPIDPFKDFGPDNPLVMSAAGLIKYPAANTIHPFAGADFNVVGSITLKQRDGNPGVSQEYFDNPLYSVNNWGMPNEGCAVIEVRPFGESAGRMIVSIAGFSPEEYAELYRRLASKGIAVEANFGCPNVEGHSIVSYHPQSLADNLAAIKPEYERNPTAFGIKVSPYTDLGQLAEIAAVINEAGFVLYVAGTNTIAACRAWTQDLKHAIRTTDTHGNETHNGGGGGAMLNRLSLMNAEKFVVALKGAHFIRVGGIRTGMDLWETHQVGALGVQIGTAATYPGPNIFTKVKQEYADIQA